MQSAPARHTFLGTQVHARAGSSRADLHCHRFVMDEVAAKIACGEEDGSASVVLRPSEFESGKPQSPPPMTEDEVAAAAVLQKAAIAHVAKKKKTHAEEEQQTGTACESNRAAWNESSTPQSSPLASGLTRAQALEDLFDECDDDGSGALSIDEFAQMADGKMSDAMKAAFAATDTVPDGKVTKGEFVRHHLHKFSAMDDAMFEAVGGALTAKAEAAEVIDDKPVSVDEEPAVGVLATGSAAAAAGAEAPQVEADAKAPTAAEPPAGTATPKVGRLGDTAGHKKRFASIAQGRPSIPTDATFRMLVRGCGATLSEKEMDAVVAQTGSVRNRGAGARTPPTPPRPPPPPLHPCDSRGKDARDALAAPCCRALAEPCCRALAKLARRAASSAPAFSPPRLSPDAVRGRGATRAPS